MTRATILVSIANYRDPQIGPTVLDLLAKADRPDLIKISVLSQIDPIEDTDCVPPSLPGQLISGMVTHEFSRGVCWARSEILTKMYQSPAEFVLQIDSHSRFVQGWDTLAFQNYIACADTRAIVTCYPTAFIPDKPLPAITYTPHRISRIGQGGLPVFSSANMSMDDAPVTPQRTACLAGGCLFTRIEAFLDVNYDPFLYFGGEEFTMAARFYTHGYNSYTPNQPWMYHQYDDPVKARPRHWKDNHDWGERNALSFKRFRHLLGLETTTDAKALEQLDRYGLGQQRSLAQYEAFAGIDLKRGLISDRAKTGLFGE